MYVVSGKPENMRPVRLYFDEQTGLLTRVLRHTEVPLGSRPCGWITPIIGMSTE